MRIMGLDYGSKTVGVAISDERGIVALPIETIQRDRENKLRQTFARIERLITEYDVGMLLLGYPKGMNESIGEQAIKTERFLEELKRRTGLEATLWDERLTTRAANQALIQAGVKEKRRKDRVDEMAAAILLQGYLDYKNKNENVHENQRERRQEAGMDAKENGNGGKQG